MVELALVSLLLLLRPQLESVSSTSPCKTRGRQQKLRPNWVREAQEWLYLLLQVHGNRFALLQLVWGQNTQRRRCYGIKEAEGRRSNFLLTLTDASALCRRVLPSFISWGGGWKSVNCGDREQNLCNFTVWEVRVKLELTWGQRRQHVLHAFGHVPGPCLGSPQGFLHRVQGIICRTD